MNKLDVEERKRVVAASVEGNPSLHTALHSPNEWILNESSKLAAAVALYYMHHNFCRIHQSLRVTPAMEAGVSPTRFWSIEKIVSLWDLPQ